VCGEASPDCRYSTDGELVLCHGNIDFDPNHPEWHYLGVAVMGCGVYSESEKMKHSIARSG
ncbi:MAG: hypothetical protein ACKPIC_13185, partial [Microcystis panniformis]